MPYGKPQQLRDGYRLYFDNKTRRWEKPASIVDDTTGAAEFLKTALTDRRVKADWSKAELVVDPAGPWWAKTRDDFCYKLSAKDQNWVIDRLVPTVELAAKTIQAAAIDERWSWLWSQPSFSVPHAGSRPSITRPDLVAGLSPTTRCLVIDLKTTSGELSTVRWSFDSFDIWTNHLSAAGYDVAERWVLAIATRTGQDDPQDNLLHETSWIEVPDMKGSARALGRLRTAISSLEPQLAAARARGDTAAVAGAEEAIEAALPWLTKAERAARTGPTARRNEAWQQAADSASGLG